MFTRFFFGISFLAHVVSYGAAASDYHSPRTASLGGAGHAAPLLNDAMYLNPSFTSFLPSYSVAGNYDWFSYDGTDNTGKILNVSVQDGRSDIFQAGFGFTRREDAEIFTLGASKAATKRLGFGLGGKFVKANDGTDNGFQDATASATFIAEDWLQLVLVVDNVVESQMAQSYNFYREFVLGTKVNVMGIVMLYFDPHLAPDYPGSSFGTEMGAEFTLMQDLFLRLGYFNNSAIPEEAGVRGNGFAAGFGWIGPRMSIDYAFSKVLSPARGTSHVVGLTVYLGG